MNVHTTLEDRNVAFYKSYIKQIRWLMRDLPPSPIHMVCDEILGVILSYAEDCLDSGVMDPDAYWPSRIEVERLYARNHEQFVDCLGLLDDFAGVESGRAVSLDQVSLMRFCEVLRVFREDICPDVIDGSDLWWLTRAVSEAAAEIDFPQKVVRSDLPSSRVTMEFNLCISFWCRAISLLTEAEFLSLDSQVLWTHSSTLNALQVFFLLHMFDDVWDREIDIRVVYLRLCACKDKCEEVLLWLPFDEKHDDFCGMRALLMQLRDGFIRFEKTFGTADMMASSMDLYAGRGFEWTPVRQ